MPVVATGVRPAPAAAATTGVARAEASVRLRTCVVLTAARNAINRTPTSTATAPSASTGPSIRRPGVGSARRATPMGNRDDAAAAPTTARTAPPTATGTPSKLPIATRWGRVRPRAL